MKNADIEEYTTALAKWIWDPLNGSVKAPNRAHEWRLVLCSWECGVCAKSDRTSFKHAYKIYKPFARICRHMSDHGIEFPGADGAAICQQDTSALTQDRWA